MARVAGGFRTFLEDYGVVGLAIAVVIGTATTDLVNAVVNDVIMPLIGLVLPGGDWETAVVRIAGAPVRIGHLLGALIDFLIIAFMIYLFARYVLRQETKET